MGLSLQVHADAGRSVPTIQVAELPEGAASRAQLSAGSQPGEGGLSATDSCITAAEACSHGPCEYCTSTCSVWDQPQTFVMSETYMTHMVTGRSTLPSTATVKTLAAQPGTQCLLALLQLRCCLGLRCQLASHRPHAKTVLPTGSNLPSAYLCMPCISLHALRFEVTHAVSELLRGGA